jgi:hypothetical protein
MPSNGDFDPRALTHVHLMLQKGMRIPLVQEEGHDPLVQGPEW